MYIAKKLNLLILFDAALTVSTVCDESAISAHLDPTAGRIEGCRFHCGDPKCLPRSIKRLRYSDDV